VAPLRLNWVSPNDREIWGGVGEGKWRGGSVHKWAAGASLQEAARGLMLRLRRAPTPSPEPRRAWMRPLRRPSLETKPPAASMRARSGAWMARCSLVRVSALSGCCCCCCGQGGQGWCGGGGRERAREGRWSRAPQPPYMRRGALGRGPPAAGRRPRPAARARARRARRRRWRRRRGRRPATPPPPRRRPACPRRGRELVRVGRACVPRRAGAADCRAACRPWRRVPTCHPLASLSLHSSASVDLNACSRGGGGARLRACGTRRRAAQERGARGQRRLEAFSSRFLRRRSRQTAVCDRPRPRGRAARQAPRTIEH
jgi:hypothetical protein